MPSSRHNACVPNLSFFTAYDFQVVPPAGCDRYSVSGSGVLGYARSLDVWGLSGKFAWAVSVSRNQSIKFYTSNGVYSRSTDNFWVTGIVWQFRWGGGL